MLKNRIKVLLLCLVFSTTVFTGCTSDKNKDADNDQSSQNSNSIVIYDDDDDKDDKDNSSVSSKPEPEPEPEYPEPVDIDMVSVGDDLIHSSIYKQANNRAGESGKYDWDFAYENIADIIQDADFATINQETMMSSEHEPSTYPQFNSPQSLGDHLITIGFDMFSIANNHMLDVYEKGLLSTIEYFKSKAPAVIYAGAYETKEEMMQPKVYIKDDIKLGFVSMTQYTNGLSLPEGSDVGFIMTTETELIKQKIEATKAVSDIVIVNVHWGDEYSYEPTQGQKDLAKQMVSWGANIIIGHHPHVLQPIEYIENDDGTHALIAYSLGNFISAQDQMPRMLGGMLHYTITKNYETGVVDVVDPQLQPIITHYNSGFSDIQIYPLEDYTLDLANRHGLGLSLEGVNNLLTDIIPEEFLTEYHEEIAD